jgi:hypothetical protein
MTLESRLGSWKNMELFTLETEKLERFKVCMGSVCLMVFDNREFLWQDVRYVPELKRNLLSITMLDGLGYVTKLSMR